MRQSIRLVIGFSLLVGCSRTVAIPNYSPTETARAAFTEYDKDGDGALDAAELERCPALKSFVKRRGKAKTLLLADLEQELLALNQGTIGSMAVSVRVMRAGNPLSGARVTLVPEKFHGTTLKSASGVTGNDGRAQMEQEGSGQIGAAPGFYRIVISLKDAQGSETLPARYNSATELGEQIHTSSKGGIVIKLD